MAVTVCEGKPKIHLGSDMIQRPGSWVSLLSAYVDILEERWSLQHSRIDPPKYAVKSDKRWVRLWLHHAVHACCVLVRDKSAVLMICMLPYQERPNADHATL